MLARKLVWKETCFSCPEQYDVMYGSKQVAYVRLRWGYLSMESPDCGGKLVYEHSFDDGFKGDFDSEEEREKYKSEMADALIKYLEEQKQNAKQTH